MASDLTYKLSQLQVSPPPAVWKQLRTRLDDEYNANDVRIAIKLDEAAIIPPFSVWDNIRSELTQTSVSRPGRVIALPYRKLAAAAAIIGVVGFAAWYLLMSGGNNSPKSPAVTAAVSTTLVPQKNNPPVPKAEKPHDRQAPAVTTTSTGTPSAASQKSSLPVNTQISRPVPINRNPSSRQLASSKPEPTPAYAISPVSADHAFHIDAPPIRDEQGNIVMNVQLVKSAADDRYIIVTSPNGQQTRISEKFLNILQYLHTQDEDYIGPDIYQRHFWKERIHEWKNKLIHSAGFFPSNNNFLGIMDLRDMIQQDK